MNGKRQKTQLRLASEAGGEGEALGTLHRGPEPVMAKPDLESPTSTDQLMEEVLERENMRVAWKRVKANKGSAGADGMTIEATAEHLKTHWPAVREQLLAGNYKPLPVRRVEIPKPDGGIRKLGIPAVVDRLIQQATLQVLQKRWDRTFSESSFGFRPGRSAHQAVAKAQGYIQEGFTWVVDLDLEKFFDRVNHDVLMSRVARRVSDKRLLKLIRAYLDAGVMENGLVNPTDEGTPQGWPLSPLLSNLLLDDFDKELEKREHRFVRYADDSNIYVRSERAGQRVMGSVTRFLETRLRLKINQQKSAVARPRERKFLGFSFTSGEKVKRRIAPKAITRFKARIKDLTRRNRGIGIEQMVKDLTRYLTGWRGYFAFCETPSVLKGLDGWIRRKLRCVQWKQWKRGRVRYKEMVRLGVPPVMAAQTAKADKGPWRMSRTPALTMALSFKHLSALGLPSLAQ